MVNSVKKVGYYMKHKPAFSLLISFILLLGFTVYSLMLTFTAYGITPEQAKSKLKKLNIEYNDDEYINRIKKGDIIVVKLFLSAGMNPNKLITYGETALITAAEYGQIEIVKLLINRGAKIDQRDGYGATALILAAGAGHINIMKLLIEKGADIHAETTNPKGENVYTYAADRGRIEVLKYLISLEKDNQLKTANLNLALMHTAFWGNKDTMKFLIANGANVNTRIEERGYFCGYTPLMISLMIEEQGVTTQATDNQKAELVKILIANGANVNAELEDGTTALKIAKEHGYIMVVQLLKKAGAIEVEPTHFTFGHSTSRQLRSR